MRLVFPGITGNGNSRSPLSSTPSSLQKSFPAGHKIDCFECNSWQDPRWVILKTARERKGICQLLDIIKSRDKIILADEEISGKAIVFFKARCKGSQSLISFLGRSKHVGIKLHFVSKKLQASFNHIKTFLALPQSQLVLN